LNGATQPTPHLFTSSLVNVCQGICVDNSADDFVMNASFDSSVKLYPEEASSNEDNTDYIGPQRLLLNSISKTLQPFLWNSPILLFMKLSC
jgi:hypothetical protein